MPIKNLLKIFVVLLPWVIRRHLLAWIWHYEIHPTARIGLAWVFPETLVMQAGSRIGHLTMVKGLNRLELGEYSSIGRGNWITGFPRDESRHFAHQPERDPSLVLGDHSAVTNRHLIDCTERVTIGKFSTVAGFRSQFITHSIDLELCRQSSQPIRLGDYTFVGTDCVILGGSVLPDKSVLGAKSLLNKAHDETGCLYAGAPARRIKAISETAKYFRRTTGFVE